MLEDNEEEAEWSDYFTTDQWVISYTSFRTYEAYPNNNDIFTIEASEGNQLLVLQFDVKNISNQKIKLNLMDEGYKYKLILGDRNYTPMLSILEDGGLLFLDVSIKPKKTHQTVLIFEVPMGADFTSMRLSVEK